ncbi:MAG: outer membrane lipoprotein carrier protein LolA [Bacteroidales bacterium]|jgi:outer membrane lipoprotein-sorting protein|nr:outer membrane lipoprotein carrier protein LolA [Bacteroidales bacterium]
MKRIYLIIFLWNIATAVVQAQDGFQAIAATNDFKKRLNESSVSIQTLTGSFTQVKYIDLLEEKMVSEGAFAYKKSDRIRFDYTAPERYLLVVNEQQVKIVADGKTNIYDLKKNKTAVQMNLLMSACMTGDIDRLNVDYQLLFHENGEQYRIRILPNTNNLTVQQMDILIDKKDFAVQQLKITETSGDYTLYSFSEQKKNTAVPDAWFNIGTP